MLRTTSILARSASFAVAAFLASAPLASAESVLRVAMTAGDIPLTVGQPDQGFEGNRFVANNLYDGLTLWDLSQGETDATIAPGLAVSWELDPGNTLRWIFKLREGVKFHDGSDFNADSVVWNFDRLTNEAHSNFNAQQFSLARVRTVNIAGVEKLDDYTVAFTTHSPDSFLPLNMTYIYMISKAGLEAAGGDYIKFASAPSGTGPYRFDKVTPRERLELVANKDYWNPERVPKHDRLVLLPMPEANTRAAALVSGQVDFIEAPSPDTLPMLEGSGMQVITNPYPHNWGYQLNFVDGPFKDKKVRQAANHAINRAEMVAMLNGIATESYAAYPEGSEYYGNPVRYDYDPEKAKALLAEAGCAPCEVTLAISTSGSGQMQPLPMNELVKSQMEAVGFTVTLDVMDWNKLLDANRKGRETYPDYDGINISRSVQDPFLGFFRLMMTSEFAPKGGNFGHYSNPVADELIAKIYATFDEAARADLIRQAHELFVEDAMMIFVVHDLNPRAMAPNVKGFVQARNWFQDLTPISVE